MTRTELISRARAAMNDKQPFDEVSVTEMENLPTKPVASYIDAAIDDAMAHIMLIAPTEMLMITAKEIDITTTEITSVPIGAKAYAVVCIPTNYRRFVGAKLAGWMKPVRTLSEERAYGMQLHDATMSSNSNPCVFDIGYDMKDNTQVRILHMFPYNVSSDKKHYLYYIPKYDNGLSNANGTEKYFSDELLSALTYDVAMRVMTFFGKDASALAALYKGEMEGVFAGVTAGTTHAGAGAGHSRQ